MLTRNLTAYPIEACGDTSARLVPCKFGAPFLQ
jgi:hypothetical protein